MFAEAARPQNRRRVAVTTPPHAVRTLPAILSVELADNEIVEWTWTRWPEGWVVTGYRIVTPDRQAAAEEPTLAESAAG
jgi:hypothetical protein